MPNFLYFDGILKIVEDIDINPAEPGFLYGAGLFETIRVENGIPLFLEEHLKRLLSGSELLGWQTPDPNLLEQAVKTTLSANRVALGRVRLNLLLGSTGYHVLVTAQTGLPYSLEDYRRGYAACISKIRKNHHSPLSFLKTMNYLEYLLAWNEARSLGAQEALLLNLDGFLAEGSRTNVFIVRQGILFTPDLSSGPLPGLVRNRVLRLALRLGLKVEEKPLSPGELFDGEEAFLTNSLMEIMPLTYVDGRPIGTGEPGPITTRLSREYRKSKTAALLRPPV
ncbi:MAG TPA: aminotransferase class IV [Peptococcaceae bacterium]|nr:aminotransferase class IV [Peptococcaceae bacterium]